MEALLSGLRDVEGVLGSFVLDADGKLLARDLPPLFEGQTLVRASLHLSRLRAALESDGSSFESCTARFGPHMLLLRAAHALTLCVLLPRGINLAAVQMSATLIARRLTSSSSRAEEARAAPARESRAEAVEAPRGSPRFFRGRRV